MPAEEELQTGRQDSLGENPRLGPCWETLSNLPPRTGKIFKDLSSEKMMVPSGPNLGFVGLRLI